MDALIRCDATDLAFDLFDLSIPPPISSSIHPPTMEATSRGKEYSLPVIGAYFRMHGIVPNVRTFNILIKGFRGQRISRTSEPVLALDNQNIYQRCQDVVTLMRQFNLVPDVVTMNTLVDISVVMGDLEVAERVRAYFSLHIF